MNPKKPQAKPPISLLQISAAVVALLVGFLLYLMFRSPHETYFIHRVGLANLGLDSILPDLLGTFAGPLPSFLHVFSFSVLTAGVMACKQIGCLIVTLIWFFTNSFFEVGQRFGSWFVANSDWGPGIPVLENVGNFFAHGTFDPLDLVAAAVGAAAAYLFLAFTVRRRNTP